MARGHIEAWKTSLDALAASCPVALSLPTLPLPPLFHTAGWQAGALEAHCHAIVSEMVAWAACRPRIRVLNRQRLDLLSPLSNRLDPAASLAVGFPYTQPHAECLASQAACLMLEPAPMKGLITDLDDTLWRGILGETGPDGVSWQGKAQVHGLYQQMLAALAESGALLAVASKNDPVLVDECLRRSDLLISPDRFFPVQAHWNAKSGSVSAILRVWNIGADSVVFVDDSPLELAEVQAAHPGITCLPFPERPRRTAGTARSAA